MGEAQGVFFSGTSSWDASSTSNLWREDKVRDQSLGGVLPCYVGWLSQKKRLSSCLHEENWDKLPSSHGGPSDSRQHWPDWMDPANDNWSTPGKGPWVSQRHSLMLFLPWRSGCSEGSRLSFQASVKCPVWNIKDRRILFRSFTFYLNQFLCDVSIFFSYVIEISLNQQSSHPNIVNCSFLGNKVAFHGFLYGEYPVVLLNFSERILACNSSCALLMFPFASERVSSSLWGEFSVQLGRGTHFFWLMQCRKDLVCLLELLHAPCWLGCWLAAMKLLV